MHPNFRWIGKSIDGETITLKKFSGTFASPDYATPQWLAENADKIRTGVVIDVETTGLNKRSDAVIEIGLRQFRFNRATGELLAIGASYSGLQDPGRPLTPEITRITGLTDADLAGKEISWPQVERLLAEANLIIAHNAAFDRPFIEKHVTAGAADKNWACSFKQVDWVAKGFGVSKLEILSIYHGFFTDAHRALNDADALLNLLTMTDWATRRPYLNELLTNARRPMTKIVAANSPFESKDILKERGYGWDATSRVWAKLLYQDETAAEIAWLESAVYKGAFRGTATDIPLNENFR